VRFLHHADTGSAVVGATDLKYAYDWQWSPPWPTRDKKFPAPWKPEMSDPRDLGWPDDPSWLPHKLYDEPGVGYVGSYMWRRPYNAVAKAFRTGLLVRGSQPYVLIVDDVRKDDAPHEYAWYMQVAADVDLASKSADGRDVLLKDPKDNRRLLVRVLQADGPAGTPAAMQVKFETYQANKDRNGKGIMGKRLILSCRAVEPKLKVLLLPHRQGDALPKAAWNKAHTEAKLTWPDRSDTIVCRIGKDGRTRLSATRDGKALLPPEAPRGDPPISADP